MEFNVGAISVSDLLRESLSSQTKIVDVRSVEAYNGWSLKGEKRGGHIKGAIGLPLKWFRYIDWIEIVRSKNILPDHKIIIYGYSPKESREAAERFLKAGYSEVSIFDGFINDWSSNPSLPMEKLSRYQQLVSAPWLNDLLTKGKAPEFQNKFVLGHAHYQNRSAYDEGHIPGAVQLDTNWLESPQTWNRRTPEELKRALETLGITADTTVILYGRFAFPNNEDPFPGSSAGHLGAFRCAFIMMTAGVKDVRMLNGGLQSWTDEGFDLSTEETHPVPVPDFGRSIPAAPEWAVDLPEAKEILKAPDKNLVSVRSYSEFIGEVSGYNYIQKKGRIPGAVFGNCGTDAYHMENYRNLDHTTREFHEIEKMWAEAGVTPDKHNAFYCGTGWRGSEAFFNAWLMGWPRVSVFDGGWFEWSADEKNPIETGAPQEKVPA